MTVRNKISLREATAGLGNGAMIKNHLKDSVIITPTLPKSQIKERAAETAPQVNKPNPSGLLVPADCTTKSSEPISQLLDQAIERIEFYEYEAAWHRAKADDCELHADSHRAVKRVVEDYIFMGRAA